ncbi:MAG: glutamate-1-semialdehyde 2,1-aminomutase [Pseudomonadota bacterium]
MTQRRFEKSQEIGPRFHELIPGGAHTYARGDDQFPQGMAPYVTRGEGCRVWDVDDNEFIEYSMGLRSVTLGHAYPDVIRAIAEQLPLGCNFGRPNTLELECAERFLSMVSTADMVKFARNGSDTTTAAVKLARAYTGREMVALCQQHPFFSVDDWFISTTQTDAGIPQATKNLTVSFSYNDLASLEALFARHSQAIACVVMEPERLEQPQNNFLAEVKALCERHGTLLVFDEIVTGFRWHNGGAQAMYGVTPHLSCFGKAIANGFAFSALAGARDIMELGGLHHERDRVFLLSTTYGAETVGLAAAMATMAVYQREDVIGHLSAVGRRLRRGVEGLINDHRLPGHFTVFGRDCCLFFGTNDEDKNPSQPFRTLFLQECLRRGLMAPSFIVSYAHQPDDIDKTLEIVDQALAVYAQALDSGIDGYLEGRPVKPVNRARN